MLWNTFESLYDKQLRRNMDRVRYGALWNQFTTNNRTEMWTMKMLWGSFDNNSVVPSNQSPEKYNNYVM